MYLFMSSFTCLCFCVMLTLVNSWRLQVGVEICPLELLVEPLFPIRVERGVLGREGEDVVHVEDHVEFVVPFVLVEEARVVCALLIAEVLHAVAECHVPVASRNRVAVEVAHLAAVEYCTRWARCRTGRAAGVCERMWGIL